eukprot:scaffold2155_cov260-Pinguiococcus_pyrenoidosus.AAC.5
MDPAESDCSARLSSVGRARARLTPLCTERPGVSVKIRPLSARSSREASCNSVSSASRLSASALEEDCTSRLSCRRLGRVGPVKLRSLKDRCPRRSLDSTEPCGPASEARLAKGRLELPCADSIKDASSPSISGLRLLDEGCSAKVSRGTSCSKLSFRRKSSSGESRLGVKSADTSDPSPRKRPADELPERDSLRDSSCPDRFGVRRRHRDASALLTLSAAPGSPHERKHAPGALRLGPAPQNPRRQMPSLQAESSPGTTASGTARLPGIPASNCRKRTAAPGRPARDHAAESRMRQSCADSSTRTA